MGTNSQVHPDCFRPCFCKNSRWVLRLRSDIHSTVVYLLQNCNWIARFYEVERVWSQIWDILNRSSWPEQQEADLQDLTDRLNFLRLKSSRFWRHCLLQLDCDQWLFQWQDHGIDKNLWLYLLLERRHLLSCLLKGPCNSLRQEMVFAICSVCKGVSHYKLNLCDWIVWCQDCDW